jgi:Putative zincin peptidase
MPQTLIDRYHPRWRFKQQAAIDQGMLRKIDELELLEPSQLRPLAMLSLLLLLIGFVVFLALTIAAYIWHYHALNLHFTLPTILLWLLINVISYIVILAIHELIHALAFLFWGGKPYFGAKLPLALFCGAKNQLFRRNYYFVIGLAPLVVITLAAIIFTLVSPLLASYVFLATVGNVSGAAGDIGTCARLLKLPPQTLVEDTDAGYRAWLLPDDPPVSRVDVETSR